MSKTISTKDWVDYYLQHPNSLGKFIDTANEIANEQATELAQLRSELAFVKAECDALRVAVIDMHNRYHEGWNVDIGDCGYEDCQKLASALAAKG